MGKKILCLGWCDADNVINYGQILQALSMMKILRNYTDEKIEYISYFPRNIKSMIKYYAEHINLTNGHLQAYVRTRRIINRYTTELNINLKQVGKRSKLERYKNIDVMICGSDQLWHPCNYDKAFFLDFGDTSVKRIAFSVSLPKSREEQSFSQEYKKMSDSIKRLDTIAVREHSSIQLINKLANKDVISVLDPTLLVEKNMWENMIKHIDTPGQYIFVYVPNGMSIEMVDIVEKCKCVMGISDILVMLTRGDNLFENSRNLSFVDLGQFLYLIKNASLVITSSFHAVVFSMIFHTEFYAYEVDNMIRGEDCRISDILDTFGLEKRNMKRFDLKYEDSIDFQSVDDMIEHKKREALVYLNNEML